MAFKRSAVRSRLSPPKSSEIVWFQNSFLFIPVLNEARRDLESGAARSKAEEPDRCSIKQARTLKRSGPVPILY